MRPLLLLVLAACAPKIDPGPIPVEQAAEPVRLLTHPEPALPVVYLQATVAAGSAYDPVGSEGLAHLSARSLVEAGAGDRSADALRAALAPTGNDFEVVVDREQVTLRLKCHVDHEALCVELFTDVLTRPAFEADTVERLREDALYQVTDGLLSDEEALGLAVLEAVLYEGHPYAHPPEGRAGVLPTLEASDADAFHARHYVREAMVVGIAGGYAPETADLLRRGLEAVPPRRAPELILLQPLKVEGRTLAVVDTGGASTGFHLGHPLDVTRDDPDWAALHVAVTALGAHRQSFGRLYRTLRGDRGLNYGDYAYIEPYRERSTSSAQEQGTLRQQPAFTVWLRPTAPENAPFALKLALDELERFVADGLTVEEHAETVSYLRNQAALLARDPGRRLAYAMEAEAAGVPDLLTQLPAALDTLTREEVNDAVRRHLRPADLRIAAVTGDPEDLVAKLVEDRETPIVYRDVTPDEAVAARDAEVAKQAVDLSAEDTWTLDAEGIFR